MQGLDDLSVSELAVNIDMLASIKARYISGAFGIWQEESKLSTASLNNYKTTIGDIISDIDSLYSIESLIHPIIEAGIFETIGSNLNTHNIQIPNYVLSEFGQPLIETYFTVEDMRYDNYAVVDNHRWPNGCELSLLSGYTPDISKIKTQMWYYWLATLYIDLGIEALHLGQIHIIDDNDNSHEITWDLLQKIRNYAEAKNRGVVLLRAHTKGIRVTGTNQLLFDFHSFPTRLKDVSDESWGSTNGGNCIISEISGCTDSPIYGKSEGGHTYFGWDCVSLPYFVDIDNYGISSTPNTYNGMCYPWGWDEITWFGIQDETYRNDWLIYAYYKVQCIDKNGYLNMPGRRQMTRVDIPYPDFYNAAMGDIVDGYYSQANTIGQIWDGIYESPENWIHNNFTDNDVFTENLPNGLNSTTIVEKRFVSSDDKLKLYYIGTDQRIHGYVKDNGTWYTVSPSWAAHFSGQDISTQKKALSNLIVDPSGDNLYYIGVDGLIYRYKIDNKWSYTYSAMPTNATMISENISAIGSLVFAGNEKIFYVA